MFAAIQSREKYNVYTVWDLDSIQFERKKVLSKHAPSLSGADSSHFNCYVSSTFQGACEGVPLPWKRSVPTTEFPNSLDNFQPLYIFFLFFFFYFLHLFLQNIATLLYSPFKSSRHQCRVTHLIRIQKRTSKNSFKGFGGYRQRHHRTDPTGISESRCFQRPTSSSHRNDPRRRPKRWESLREPGGHKAFYESEHWRNVFACPSRLLRRRESRIGGARWSSGPDWSTRLPSAGLVCPRPRCAAFLMKSLIGFHYVAHDAPGKLACSRLAFDGPLHPHPICKCNRFRRQLPLGCLYSTIWRPSMPLRRCQLLVFSTVLGTSFG